MVALLHDATLPPAPPRYRAVHGWLPQRQILDVERGILLLASPRAWWRPQTFGVGCAWAVESRNIEVCDEMVCLDMARMHESLLRGLPVGSVLQVLLMIRPTRQATAWGHLRYGHHTEPLLDAQRSAIRQGCPTRPGRCRAASGSFARWSPCGCPCMGCSP